MGFITVSNGKGQGYRTNDKITTPVNIAKQIISLLPINPEDVLYDPFRGSGAFYNNYPEHNKKHYSEIDEGLDFFDFNNKVDWIISNPPYSLYTEVMRHSYELAENIVYLIPLSKLVSSMGRIRELKRYGGIKKLWILPASKCGFPFGFPACVVWIQKGYNSKYIEVEEME